MLQHKKNPSTNKEPVGCHVELALEAAKMTKLKLMQKYPYITEKGYLRPSSTGSLYRRIGVALLQIPPSLLKSLLSVQKDVGLTNLREIGKKSRSLQENISKVRLMILALNTSTDGQNEKARRP